jgi:hypothetical protein
MAQVGPRAKLLEGCQARLLEDGGCEAPDLAAMLQRCGSSSRVLHSNYPTVLAWVPRHRVPMGLWMEENAKHEVAPTKVVLLRC